MAESSPCWHETDYDPTADAENIVFIEGYTKIDEGVAVSAEMVVLQRDPRIDSKSKLN